MMDEEIAAKTSRKTLARRLRRKAAKAHKAGTLASVDDVSTAGQPQGLLANFLRIQTQVITPRTTNFGARSKWLIVPAVRHGMPRLLTELESDQAQKMGPRNLYDPLKLRAAITSYSIASAFKMQSQDVKVCEDIALDLHKRLNLPKLAISPRLALSLMLLRQKDSSAGYPWFKQREVVCANYLPDEFIRSNPERYEQDLEKWRALGKPDALRAPAEPIYAINYRTEAPDKVRLVHAAALGNQILESRFAIPIQDALVAQTTSEDVSHGGLFSYMNPALLHHQMMNLVAYGQQHEVNCHSIDYSQFDAHVSSDLIRLAFIALFGAEDDWSDDQRKIAYNFANKQLLTPWGTYNFQGGVPSGSIFTNLVDTVVNGIDTEFLGLTLGLETLDRANGDDKALVTVPEVTVKQLEDSSARLGLLLHKEKQAIARDSFIFNKAYHGTEFGGRVPSENRIINSARYYDSQMKGFGPDKRLLDDDEEILRTLQLVGMMEFHPYRDEFLAAVAKVTGRDGKMMIDYRYRLPRLSEKVVLADSPYEVRTVRELDSSWISNIYEGGLNH